MVTTASYMSSNYYVVGNKFNAQRTNLLQRKFALRGDEMETEMEKQKGKNV